MTLVSRPGPAFEAEYAEAPTRGICSCTQVTLIILPPVPRPYHPPRRPLGAEERKRVGWEVAVRIEKALCTVLNEH
jgi:hypothetical protein